MCKAFLLVWSYSACSMSFSFAWAKLRRIFKLWHTLGKKKTDSTYDTVSPFVVECMSLFSERDGSEAHAARGRDGRQEGRERGYYHLHRYLNNPLLHASPPFRLILVEAIVTIVATADRTRVDHEAGSLSGHGEVTGVDAIVLSEFDLRTIDGCRGHLTCSRRDADLHLVILIQVGTRGHSVTILGDACRTTTARYDGQRITLRGMRAVLTRATVITLRTALATSLVALRILNGTCVGRGHTLHDVTVAVVTGDLD